MASVKLFVKENCGRCPAAKGVACTLKSEGFKVHEYALDTAEGMAEGAFYGVMSTPTMLIVDGHENTLCAWRGAVPPADEVKRALKAFKKKSASH